MSERLKLRAQGIRDETVQDANTAERVGGVMMDTIAELDDLKAKLDDFIGFTYIGAINFLPDGGGVQIGVKTTCENWNVE